MYTTGVCSYNWKERCIRSWLLLFVYFCRTTECERAVNYIKVPVKAMALLDWEILWCRLVDISQVNSEAVTHAWRQIHRLATFGLSSLFG